MAIAAESSIANIPRLRLMGGTVAATVWARLAFRVQAVLLYLVDIDTNQFDVEYQRGAGFDFTR